MMMSMMVVMMVVVMIRTVIFFPLTRSVFVLRRDEQAAERRCVRQGVPGAVHAALAALSGTVRPAPAPRPGGTWSRWKERRLETMVLRFRSCG